MAKSPSVNRIVMKLAKAAKEEKLVLFVGTGFSKAILGLRDENGEGGQQVPSWIGLLQDAATQFQLAINLQVQNQDLPIDCPELASIIKQRLAQGSGSDKALKGWVAKRFETINPTEYQKRNVKPLIEELSPRLVITTNYDHILESCIGVGQYVVKGPQDELTNEKGTIVYHMHGSASSPSSLVLTREDYVRRMRPGAYSQLKIAMLMREATVLFVGYSRNDINVLLSEEIAKYSFWDLNERNVATYCIDFKAGLQTAECDDGPESSNTIKSGDVLGFLQEIVKAKSKVKTADEFVGEVVAGSTIRCGVDGVAGSIENGVVKKLMSLENGFANGMSNEFIGGQLGNLLKFLKFSKFELKGSDKILLRLEMLLSKLQDCDSGIIRNIFGWLDTENLAYLSTKSIAYNFEGLNSTITNFLENDRENECSTEPWRTCESRLEMLVGRIKEIGGLAFREVRIPLANVSKENSIRIKLQSPYIICDVCLIYGDRITCVEFKTQRGSVGLKSPLFDRYKFVAKAIRQAVEYTAKTVTVVIVCGDEVFECTPLKTFQKNKGDYYGWLEELQRDLIESSRKREFSEDQQYVIRDLLQTKGFLGFGRDWPS